MNRVLKHYQFYAKQLKREHPVLYMRNKKMLKDYLNKGKPFRLA